MNHPIKPNINEEQEEVLYNLTAKFPLDEGHIVDVMIELRAKQEAKHESAHQVVQHINDVAGGVGHILRDKDAPYDASLIDAYTHALYE